MELSVKTWVLFCPRCPFLRVWTRVLWPERCLFFGGGVLRSERSDSHVNPHSKMHLRAKFHVNGDVHKSTKYTSPSLSNNDPGLRRCTQVDPRTLFSRIFSRRSHIFLRGSLGKSLPQRSINTSSSWQKMSHESDPGHCLYPLAKYKYLFVRTMLNLGAKSHIFQNNRL